METKSLYLVFTLVLFIGCNKKDTKNNPSDFEAYINSHPLAEVKKVNNYKKSLNEQINEPLRLSISPGGKVIVIDDSDWSLHMLATSGKIINSTSGVGKGPGEFLQINDIFIDNNERLYVYDGKMKRITIFDLTEETFELVNVVNLPKYESLYFKSFYINGNYRIGVFNKRIDKRTGDTKKVFYRLKNNFELDTKITSIPGNEKIKGRNYWFDKPLGKSMLWDIQRNILYYAHNKTFTVHSLNLKNKKKQTLDFTDEPVFKITTENQKYLNEFFSPLRKMYDNYDQIIKETESLPLFTWFKVHKNNIYFTLFNPSKKKGSLLRMNIETGGLDIIKVPYRFVLYDIFDDRLFGINHENNEVTILQLSDTDTG